MFRFSLRELFFLMLITAMGIGWWNTQQHNKALFHELAQLRQRSAFVHGFLSARLEVEKAKVKLAASRVKVTYAEDPVTKELFVQILDLQN